jgi:hypothetical protein
MASATPTKKLDATTWRNKKKLAEALNLADSKALDDWLQEARFKGPWDDLIEHLLQFRDDRGRLGRAQPLAKIRQAIGEGSSNRNDKYDYEKNMDFSGWERLDFEAFAFLRVFKLITSSRGIFHDTELSEGEIYERIGLIYRRLLHDRVLRN